VGVEHAATTGTQHVPGEIEQPEAGGMQESGNNPLFVEAGSRRKIQEIDAVELMILAILDQVSNGIGYRRVGGLFQQRNLRLDIAHAATLEQIAHASK
jgi:hypothetical protein